MTFADLKNLFAPKNNLIETIAQQQQERVQDEQLDTILYDKFKHKPFWIWNESRHKKLHKELNGEDCFNHIIGLPQKYGIERPIYPFQKILLDKLFEISENPERRFQDKHLVLLKSAGIGASEIFLRLLCWLALKDKKYSGTDFCIITAPRLELSVSLIDRLKKLFLPKLAISFHTKETTVILNGVKISAFPSHNLSAMRGIPAVSFIFADEFDLGWYTSEETDLKDTIERYIGKSSPYIVLCSTPGAPGSMLERLLNEPDETCLYKKLRMDYKVGLGTIYSNQEIENAKRSASFLREYCLHFGGTSGNIFHESDILEAIKKGDMYPYPTAQNVSPITSKVMGIDVGYGSSNFSIVILEFIDGLIRVVYNEEFERPDFNAMLHHVGVLLGQFPRIAKVYIDGSAVSFIRAIKNQSNEDTSYEDIIKDYRKKNWDWESTMNFIPVSFGVEHITLLSNLKLFLEKGRLAIHSNYDKVLTSLRSATEKREGVLDKDNSAFNDTLDAMRLACRYFSFKDNQENRRAALVQSFQMNRRFSK